VNDIAVSKLYIYSSENKISVGYSKRFNVYAQFEDGYSQNIHYDINWSSSDKSVASIDNGLVFAKSVGTSLIEASLLNVSAYYEVQVVDVALERVDIIPEYASVLVDGYLNYRAKAYFRDGRTDYLDYLGIWDIPQQDEATINYSGLLNAHQEGKVKVEFIYKQKLYSTMTSIYP
jgi:uncharacterized protein YjdB